MRHRSAGARRRSVLRFIRQWYGDQSPTPEVGESRVVDDVPSTSRQQVDDEIPGPSNEPQASNKPQASNEPRGEQSSGHASMRPEILVSVETLENFDHLTTGSLAVPDSPVRVTRPVAVVGPFRANSVVSTSDDNLMDWEDTDDDVIFVDPGSGSDSDSTPRSLPAWSYASSESSESREREAEVVRETRQRATNSDEERWTDISDPEESEESDIAEEEDEENEIIEISDDEPEVFYGPLQWFDADWEWEGEPPVVPPRTPPEWLNDPEDHYLFDVNDPFVSPTGRVYLRVSIAPPWVSPELQAAGYTWWFLWPRESDFATAYEWQAFLNHFFGNWYDDSIDFLTPD